jgi:signal transduction histidine kinase
MVARVRVSALTPTDTTLRLPSGARMQIVERGSRLGFLPSFVPDSLLAQERFTAGGHEWLAVHRSLVAPEIDVILAAPLTAYVQPFERAAATGTFTLTVASLLALLVTAFLTTRLTGSLQRLAIAADAVAGGDLDHRVDAGGRDEVGRVGAAFNSMLENLRRTLGELSKRQALAAVGEYAAELAHAVRNGLTSVRIDLQRAEEKIARDTPGQLLVARSLESVRRLEGTVSDSLRVARGRRAPKRRVDLRLILAAAVESSESAFTDRGAVIEPRPLHGAPAWVLGNRMTLEQLFLNLLLNAAQALDRGGRAAVSLDGEGSEVRITVSDSGTGIPSADLERVFEPFYSTKADGTGLGMSIARQIAVDHGGSLRIERGPAGGTRAVVRLPTAAPPAARRTDRNAIAAP